MPIQPLGTRPPIFCVHGGAGTILHLEPLGAPARARPAVLRAAVARAVRRRSAAARPSRRWRRTTSRRSARCSRQARMRSPATASARSSRSRWRSAARRGRGGRSSSRCSTARARPGSSAGAGSGTSRRSAAPRPARCALTRSEKVRRAVREPFRIRRAFLYHSVGACGDCRRASRSLAAARCPRALREEYFLRIHGKAERAYEPTPYPGDMLTFFGDGLYEDPELGWDELGSWRRRRRSRFRASTRTTAR